MTHLDKIPEIVDQTKQPVFLTLVRSSDDARSARILIESLREYGGQLNRSRFWIFLSNGMTSPPELQELTDVDFFPVEIETEHSQYILGDKVYVCAQAEMMATARDIDSLVWMSAYSMILKPPDLFELGTDYNAALRAVHIKNIGSPMDEPIDSFWQAVYHKIDLRESALSVISLVDQSSIRPYFNTHLFSIRPNIHLLERWSEVYYDLITDTEFQNRYCQDIEHQIFLHQATFSALILKMVAWNCVRQLPTSYSYPLHLHHQVPVPYRAHLLNELVCPVFEGRFQYPNSLNGLEVYEPLDEWLSARIAK
jgi:hypothetical protein